MSDVIALASAIGEPIHLVGHDWGGGIAWGTAAWHPESIASLTGVSVGHPAAFFKSFLRSSQLLKSYYMAVFQLPFLPEWLMSRRDGIAARVFLRHSGMTPDMIDWYYREIVDDGALRGGLGYYRSMFLMPPGFLTHKVTVPTAYVWSDEDIALGRTAAELTARYVTDDYTYEVMEGVSHWIPEERPAELATIIAKRAGL